MARFGALLAIIDTAALAIFTIEIAARLAVHRKALFKDPSPESFGAMRDHQAPRAAGIRDLSKAQAAGPGDEVLEGHSPELLRVSACWWSAARSDAKQASSPPQSATAAPSSVFRVSLSRFAIVLQDTTRDDALFTLNEARAGVLWTRE